MELPNNIIQKYNKENNIVCNDKNNKGKTCIVARNDEVRNIYKKWHNLY